jgi:transposase-like protein
MGQRRRFTPEFKRQAVQLMNAGQRPAAEIARELGIPRNRLYRKQKRYRESFPTPRPADRKGSKSIWRIAYGTNEELIANRGRKTGSFFIS